MPLRERIGELLGDVWAPAIAAIARLRHARMFHPEGQTYAGHVEVRTGPYEVLARRLAPLVLARLSPALWRGGVERLDVLGCALRFHRTPTPSDVAARGDQDLLFATIRSPLTMPFSPFATNAHDFLANRYWAVAPFEVEGIDHRVELRLSPIEPPDLVGPRAARLDAAVRLGRAELLLEARRTLRLRWHPVATITLDAPIAVDDEHLRFDPFASGAGLQPVGLVHAIRHAAYAASQRGRLSVE